MRFSVDAYPEREFMGKVAQIRLSPQITNNVVTYPVWITVPNPDLKLRPAMTASLRIILSTASNVVRGPLPGLAIVTSWRWP